MSRTATVQLAGGYWEGEKGYFEAQLRQPTGDDDLFLAEAGADLPLPHLATALLTRCLTRLGPLQPVTEETVRRLTVGDREALLLHLRRLAFSDALACVLNCPACNDPLDLDLRVSDLILPVTEVCVGTAYEMGVGGRWAVACPNRGRRRISG